MRWSVPPTSCASSQRAKRRVSRSRSRPSCAQWRRPRQRLAQRRSSCRTARFRKDGLGAAAHARRSSRRPRMRWRMDNRVLCPCSRRTCSISKAMHPVKSRAGSALPKTCAPARVQWTYSWSPCCHDPRSSFAGRVRSPSRSPTLPNAPGFPSQAARRRMSRRRSARSTPH